MTRYVDVMAHLCELTSYEAYGTKYQIEANNGDLYWVFVGAATQDVTFCKSSDHGLTWSAPVLVWAGLVEYLSVWFDRWSGISAGLIHVALIETTGHDAIYVTINTESADAISTPTTIFAGVSATLAGMLSIARARGGNVYCRAQIDGGAEGGFFRLPNANVPNGAWDAARTINEAQASADECILVPGFAADNQDMMLIFWDQSANEISRQVYDDSANTWAETSISTGFVAADPNDGHPQFAASVDLSNSRIILIAWTGRDTADADLKCWTITESAITAKTDVVTDGVDDQAMAAIELDTASGYWYAFYGGKSDGSDTWSTSMDIYYKVSTDQGATWGAETRLTQGEQKLPASTLIGLSGVPRFASLANFSPVHTFDNGTGGSGASEGIARVTVQMPPASPPIFADVMAHVTDIITFNRFCTNYKVEANNGDIYWVFVSGANNDLLIQKSTNGGLTWQEPISLFVGTVQQIAVWFDRWSSIAAGLIHIAWCENGGNDTLYRTVDTENADALSTQTTIFNGASTANNGHLSIARARGGNVYCKTVIDAGAEGGFFRLPNANVPNGAWDAARTIDEALATQDQMILLPGFAADNQDMLAIFWDGSANEISRKIYDDSANSWGETSISTSFTDLVATTAHPNFSAVVDLANSRIILIAWNNTDTANADLKCWTITESAITAKTDVVTDGTDDQGLCALGLDTTRGDWYAFYGGKSDGSDTWTSSMPIYYKRSTDGGSTWSSETRLTSAAILLPQTTIKCLISCPRFAKLRNWSPIHCYDSTNLDVACRTTIDISRMSAAVSAGVSASASELGALTTLQAVTAALSGGAGVAARAIARGSVTAGLGAGASEGRERGVSGSLAANLVAGSSGSALADAIAAVIAAAQLGESWAGHALAAAEVAGDAELGAEFLGEFGSRAGFVGAGTQLAATFTAACEALARVNAGASLGSAAVGVALAMASLAGSIELDATFAESRTIAGAAAAGVNLNHSIAVAANALASVAAQIGLEALISAALALRVEVQAGASFGDAFTSAGGLGEILPPAKATLRVEIRDRELRAQPRERGIRAIPRIRSTRIN